MSAAEKKFLDAAEAYCVAKHNFDIATSPGGWVCGPAHLHDPSAAHHAMMNAYSILRETRASGDPR